MVGSQLKCMDLIDYKQYIVMFWSFTKHFATGTFQLSQLTRLVLGSHLLRFVRDLEGHQVRGASYHDALTGK